FMSGAASQVDTFDYKPLVIQKSGEKFDPGGKVELFQSDPGPIMKSPWEWKQHGTASGVLRGRDRVSALYDLEIQCSWAGDVHAEFRLCVAGIPQYGSLGF